MIETAARYSARVLSYARGRWDYADEAVQAVLAECGLSSDAIVADIGSGTGLLSRHFIGRVRILFAVEPNADMRAVAQASLQGHGSYHSVNGLSNATNLQDHSIDLIVAGRSLHWFPADSTRIEWRRIVKPGGWLADFTVPCTDDALLASLRRVRVEDNGWNVSADRERLTPVPLGFYLGHDSFKTLTFPGQVRETWETFRYRIGSFVAAPDQNHPLWPKFEAALRDVFNQHAVDGVLTVSNATEVEFGRMVSRTGRSSAVD